MEVFWEKFNYDPTKFSFDLGNKYVIFKTILEGQSWNYLMVDVSLEILITNLENNRKVVYDHYQGMDENFDIIDFRKIVKDGKIIKIGEDMKVKINPNPIEASVYLHDDKNEEILIFNTRWN